MNGIVDRVMLSAARTSALSHTDLRSNVSGYVELLSCTGMHDPDELAILGVALRRIIKDQTHGLPAAECDEGVSSFPQSPAPRCSQVPRQTDLSPKRSRGRARKSRTAPQSSGSQLNLVPTCSSELLALNVSVSGTNARLTSQISSMRHIAVVSSDNYFII
jgi:hypothetical protein